MKYASDFRALGRESLSGRWGKGVLVCFLAMILGGISAESVIKLKYESGIHIQIYGIDITDFFQGNMFATLLGVIFSASLVYLIIQIIIGAAVELGVCTYFTKQALRMDPPVSDEFSHFHIFMKALGLRIVIGIFTLLWTLLLIVPGIIAAYRYSMATYIMAENPEIGILDAIDQSKEMMDGNKWREFCLDFSFIGWEILCAFTLGIGNLFLKPYMQSAKAHFYLDVR